METNFSKAALLQFLEFSARKGQINTNTAGGLKAAAARLLEDVSDDQDVRNIDIEGAALKYNNRHPGELSTESLRVYTQRLQRLISDFTQYLTDPLKYKPRSRGLSKSNGAKQKAKSELKVNQPVGIEPSTRVEPAPAVAISTLALPYPLRENFMAQVVVPRNISSDEARRLCAFIMTLPADFKPHD